MKYIDLSKIELEKRLEDLMEEYDDIYERKNQLEDELYEAECTLTCLEGDIIEVKDLLRKSKKKIVVKRY